MSLFEIYKFLSHLFLKSLAIGWESQIGISTSLSSKGCKFISHTNSKMNKGLQLQDAWSVLLGQLQESQIKLLIRGIKRQSNAYTGSKQQLIQETRYICTPPSPKDQI